MIHNFIKEDHKQIKEDVQEMKSFVEQFDALKLERDALWVKTQEDEREINQLRDAVKEKAEQRDKALLIAHNLKEAIESTFTASKDPFNADSSYEYIETHGWTHEILKFAREEIKRLEVS